MCKISKGLVALDKDFYRVTILLETLACLKVFCIYLVVPLGLVVVMTISFSKEDL